MLNRVVAALLVAVSICFSTHTTATAAPQSSADHILIAKKNDGLKWVKNMSAALKEARQEHKLVFVDIGASW